MGDLDSTHMLQRVDEPGLAGRAHAAWVLLGSAAERVTVPLSAHARKDIQDVLWMLDVMAPEVLRHRPKRRRRRVVRKR